MDIEIGIKTLSGFTTEEWIAWIEASFDENQPEPRLPLGDIDVASTLIWIRNQFSKRQYSLEAFSDSVIALISQYSERRGPGDRLYSLIQFVSVLKPEKHARLLQQIVVRGVISDVYYLKINLNTLLLSSLINFVNTGDLTRHFSLADLQDPFKMVLGLKYYSVKKSISEYFEYVNDFIKISSTHESGTQLTKGLILSFNEMTYYVSNYNELFEWWVANDEHVEVQYPAIHKLITEEFLIWLNDNNKSIKENQDALRLKQYIEARSKRNSYIFFKNFIKAAKNFSEFVKSLPAADILLKNKSYEIAKDSGYVANDDGPRDSLTFDEKLELGKAISINKSMSLNNSEKRNLYKQFNE